MFGENGTGILSSIVDISEGQKILSSAEVFNDEKLIPAVSVVKKNDRYIMVLGENNTLTEDNKVRGFQIAFSNDGLDWKLQNKTLSFEKTSGEMERWENSKRFSPVLSVVDDNLYLTYLELRGDRYSNRLALVKNMNSFKVEVMGDLKARKVTLFPEKIGGKFFAVGEIMDSGNENTNGKGNFDFYLFSSRDLKEWSQEGRAIRIEDVPYANYEISNPVTLLRTSSGWLILFRAIDLELLYHKGEWKKNYFLAAALLKTNVLKKRAEVASIPLMEYRPYNIASDMTMENPLLPGGAVLNGNGQLMIYYSVAGGVYLNIVGLDRLLGRF